MITKEMILAQLDKIADDSDYLVFDNCIRLTINDFEGFNENWHEVERELDDENAVEKVLEWLEENADRIDGDYYYYYYFGEIVVKVGYDSFDI